MRLVRVLVVSIVAAVPVAHTAVAGGAVDDDSIVASADEESAGTEPDTAPQREVCTWGADQSYQRSGRFESGGYVFAYVDLLWWRIDPKSGEVWVRTWRTCRRGDEVTFNGTDWRRVTAPDPGVLGESLYDEVVRQIPLPEPALSPVGPGFVNLGMWLAVTDPGSISATATAGDVWATTSAQLESTTFDMGDGTVVVCEGAGDPIPPSQLESTEASPVCGHTYTGVNGREPFMVTVASTWRVSWTGSGGVGGDLGSVDRTSTVEYPVLEIQTVGD